MMAKLDKNITVLGCFLIALTIGFGAFGAHGLEKLVSEEATATFETGVRYQMYHALAIFIIGLVTTQIPRKVKKRVVTLFLVGIFLFSFSIYFLALSKILPFEVSFLGPITPIGGLLLITGWIYLGLKLLTFKRDN